MLPINPPSGETGLALAEPLRPQITVRVKSGKEHVGTMRGETEQ